MTPTQLDDRCEQQLQATTEAIARVACLVSAQVVTIARGLGFTDAELQQLCDGVTKEHVAIAKAIVSDALQPDMIHEIMARFGGFDATNDVDDENFRTIKNELKGIGDAN